MTAPEEHPLEIDCHTLKTWLDEKRPLLLLDCREADEVERASLPGATWIPMGQIPQRLAELEPYREQVVVVYCHHGGRSLRVTEFLRSQGFRLAQSLCGGIDRWSQQVDPRVPRY